LNGTVNNNGTPGNLVIYCTPSTGAGVNIAGTGIVFAVIYAPTSPVTLNGNAQVYGEIIGSTFNSGGGAQVHVDESLLSSPSNGTITTVQ
jgi:hypothetical protein